MFWSIPNQVSLHFKSLPKIKQNQQLNNIAFYFRVTFDLLIFFFLKVNDLLKE